MGFPKGQVTRGYKSVRALYNKLRSKKPRTGRSYTDMYGKTKTKRRRLNAYGGSGGRKKRTRIAYKSPAGDGVLGKVISCNISHMKGVTYEKNELFDRDTCLGSGTVVAATGQQGVYGRAFMQGAYTGCGTDIQTMWSNHGITTAATSRKIKSTNMLMEVLSASTGIQEVTVYIVKANKDTPSGSSGSTTPSTCWTECTNTIVTAQLPTVIGETPYGAIGFGSYWKIIKTQKVVLNPGQCFRIKIQTDEHWGPSFSTIGKDVESAAAHTNLRGRTYGVLIVTKGMPVSDSVSPLLVNYGSAKLNLTWKFTMESSTKIHANIDRFANTNTIDPLGTIAIAREVGDDDGMAITHATV